MASKHLDPVWWFDDLGTCRCGRPAVGTLRGTGNESYGIACHRCADKRLKAADAARNDLIKKAPTPAADGGGVSAIPAGYEGCGHGHVFPVKNGAKARCGGPMICSACAVDFARLAAARSAT